MTRLLRLAALPLLLALSLAAVASAASTPGPFKGEWDGHTRTLKIDSHGAIKEVIYSGCCDHVVTVHLQITAVRGDAKHGQADVKVTKVNLLDPTAYDASRKAPKVGDTGTFRLHAGVVHEPITHTVYCNLKAGDRGVCGA